MSYTQIAHDADSALRRRRVRMTRIRPDNADDLIKLVSRCSPESRYLRFHTGMDALRPAMAEQLAGIDRSQGEALGLRNWRGRLVADGRYTQISPQVAETAVLIADKYQGRGLGPILLAVLFQRAADRGIVAMHAEVLPSNTAIVKVLEKLAPVNPIGYENGVRAVCMPLTSTPCPQCAEIPVAAGH